MSHLSARYAVFSSSSQASKGEILKSRSNLLSYDTICWPIQVGPKTGPFSRVIQLFKMQRNGFHKNVQEIRTIKTANATEFYYVFKNPLHKPLLLPMSPPHVSSLNHCWIRIKSGSPNYGAGNCFVLHWVPATRCSSLVARLFREWANEWVSKWVSIPVNQLHWYWQPNKNNQATHHSNNIKIAQPKKSPY